MQVKDVAKSCDVAGPFSPVGDTVSLDRVKALACLDEQWKDCHRRFGATIRNLQTRVTAMR